MFVALKLVERREVRIAIGQVDNQADYHLMVFQVIKEGSSGVLLAEHVQWPAGGVHHQALLMLGRVDVPDFFDTDAVVLGVGLVSQVVLADQLFTQVAAAAFGEQRVFTTQFHAGGVVVLFWLAFAIHAQVAGDDAAHHAVFVDQCFLSAEPRIDIHSEALGLLGQPATQITQGNDVVAMVMHGLGEQESRYLCR